MNDVLLACLGLTAMAALAVWAACILKRRPMDSFKLAKEQLAQSRMLNLQHRAAAEEHAALADMYEVQMTRLEGLLVLKGDVK